MKRMFTKMIVMFAIGTVHLLDYFLYAKRKRKIYIKKTYCNEHRQKILKSECMQEDHKKQGDLVGVGQNSENSKMNYLYASMFTKIMNNCQKNNSLNDKK